MPSKKSHLQLYADECFPVPSVTYLKSLGFSIVHAFDYKYVQKSDRLHLKKSRSLHRILITIDRDFLYYEQVSLKDHPEVIVISAGSPTTTTVNEICKKLLNNIGETFVNASMVKVTTNKIIKIKDQKKVSEKILG
jgi:predicted nuclease of predicted toxin-antitoxin system